MESRGSIDAVLKVWYNAVMTSTEIESILPMLTILGLLAIVLVAFLLVAGWKIFKKAGEPGWKILIPIHNIYVMYKILDMADWFWITLGVSLCCELIITPNTTADGNINPTDTVSAISVMIATIVNLVVTIWASVLYSIRLSKSFGHGKGYAFGIFFLPYIFWLILGFGESKYKKIDFSKAKK